jgi:hypothetical protein
VPRSVVADARWRQDYRRPYGAGVLARWKRIVPQAGGCNRIERRYEVRDAADGVVEAFAVAEEIRPLAPEALAARLATAGFAIARTAWDYAGTPRPPQPQFVAYVARRAVDAG